MFGVPNFEDDCVNLVLVAWRNREAFLKRLHLQALRIEEVFFQAKAYAGVVDLMPCVARVVT